MTYDFPQILYKHRTWKGEFSKNILLNNEIYFSSADQFNDPFDASLPYKYDDTELTPENINKKLYQIGRRINPNMTEAELKIEVDVRQNSGVFTNGKYWKDQYEYFKSQNNKTFGIHCLTQKNDDLLMWSHYSNSHNGFCIGFDTSILFDSLQCTIGPVNYSNDFPSVPLFEPSPKDLLRLIMTKSKHWEYENEFRIIKTLFPRTTFLIPNEAFREIIFGCKISDADKEEIIKICKSKFNSIRFFDAKLNDSQFKLDIVEMK